MFLKCIQKKELTDFARPPALKFEVAHVLPGDCCCSICKPGKHGQSCERLGSEDAFCLEAQAALHRCWAPGWSADMTDFLTGTIESVLWRSQRYTGQFMNHSNSLFTLCWLSRLFGDLQALPCIYRRREVHVSFHLPQHL